MLRFRRYDISMIMAGVIGCAGALTLRASLTEWSPLVPFLEIVAYGMVGTTAMTIWHAYRRWRIFRSGHDAADDWIAVTALAWDNLAGRRPRDWQMTRPRFIFPDRGDFSPTHHGLYPAILYALDRGEIEQARLLLDRAILEETQRDNRSNLALLFEMHAFVKARYTDDVLSADDDLRRAVAFNASNDVILGEAAVLLALGDLVGARLQAEYGLRILSAANPGIGIFEADMLLDIIALASTEKESGWRTAAA